MKGNWQGKMNLMPSTAMRCIKRCLTTSDCMHASRAQELCESRGGHPGLPVHNSPYSLCRRKVTLNLNLNMYDEQVDPQSHLPSK